MDYAYKTDQAVYEMSKFKIEFCETYQNYLLNNKWVNTYDEFYFQEKIANIRSLLYITLKNGKNQKVYLQNLMDNLGKRIDWLNENRFHSPDFLENITIIETNATDIEDKPNSSQNDYEEFLKSIQAPYSSDSDIFGFLRMHKEKFNDYSNLIDFKKGRLLHAIMLYREAILELYGFISSIHESAEFTDFKNFDLIQLQPLKSGQNLRICNFNLDKKSVAHLFRILTEEKIIVFDELNEANNLLEMKKFVEQNFTYQNAKNERKAIENFNREYSEVSSPNSHEVKKHKAFIDKMVGILKDRKEILKD